MIRAFGTFFCIISLSCGCSVSKTTGDLGKQGASETKEVKMPVIHFEKKIHDFDTVRQGEVVKYDFRFRNTGKAPLIIVNAKGSSGSVIPTYPRHPILPDSTAVIGVLFNTSNRLGHQTKTVTVQSNTDPERNLLRIKALIVRKAQE